MSPSAIARAAKEAGLNAIALTDHNSALNTPAFEQTCRRAGLHALFGIEIASIEDIHCLALFDTPEAALGLSSYLYDHLPDFQNIPEKLGDQPVVDEEENVLEFVPKYLGNTVHIPFSKLPALIEQYGGWAIPAHIDRPSHSLLSQLGRLPPESGPVLEISPYNMPEMLQKYGAGHSLLTFSDSHYLTDIGRRWTDVEADDFSIVSLRNAVLAGRYKIHPGNGKG